MPARPPFSEIFANPASDPIPVGIRAGDLVHAVRITAGDPIDNTVPAGLEYQLRNAFDNMRRSIEYAGGSLDNVAHVSLFLTDARAGIAAVNAQWTETFPMAADRPTYKFMSTPLPAGQLVALEYFAVRGARRRVVNIKGVAHTNPIPMAVRIGEHLFTSRVLPMDPRTGDYPKDAAAQTDCFFANVAAVLSEAGMNWANVTQGRLFLADMANLPALEKRWAELYPDRASRPALHPTHYNVGPTLLVMLEILAVEQQS
jgi:2-iminobutanoate/2-iminopropanoate deaminase